jgi:hypothetical protein
MSRVGHTSIAVNDCSASQGIVEGNHTLLGAYFLRPSRSRQRALSIMWNRTGT